MGAGLRRAIGTIVLGLFVCIPGVGVADEYIACWRDIGLDPFSGTEVPITRCRLAGGGIVDYASDTSVPVPLYPAAGTDLTGDCWYLTSSTTNWVYLNLFVNGDAVLGWDPDPTTPGGIAYATTRIARCTSEPNPTSDPSAEVWEYVTAYIHPPPTPDLSPVVGDGVTGLPTYVGVPVPPDHSATLAAGGVTLDVEIDVAGVIVSWGDEAAETFPADPDALSGYPDGIANHVYEIKNLSGYDLAVSYDWTARWRVSGGPWVVLNVPDTTTATNYPVAEIISVITP